MASYLKRWRQNHAAALALADSSSDEEALNVVEQVAGYADFQISQDLFDQNSESDDRDLSDFGFSETVQSSDSDADASFSDNEVGLKTLKEQLSTWATSNNVSKSCVDELLTILKPQCNVELPKDCRTLLQTPRVIEYSEKCGGKYIYFGIEIGLMNILYHKSFSLDFVEENTLKLNFNIDGIPVFKSTGTQFWPILCSLGNYTPFMVSIFYGPSKPSSLEDFLADFLTELDKLVLEGIRFENERLNVQVNAFICDAPARAFLKCIKGHTGYNACERCIVHGYYKDNRVVLYSEETYTARTDDEFKAWRYPAHQSRITPLAASNIPCVSGFCLDYMHMVCLGVVKRILWFLRQGPPECKLSALQITQISNLLISFSGKLPSEFARQPRSLYDVERWKATEFRQFLLYTGPVVLKQVLSKPIYEHFLSLTVGISILLESEFEIRNSYLNYAKDVLEYFVRKSKQFYNDRFVVYNVHSLIHLADDCRHFECSLNEISGFPFENHLQSIKKLVKNAKNPIVQVAKRMQERKNAEVTGVKQKPTFSVISTKERNSCFLLKDGSYAFVKEKRDNNKTLVCQILKQEQTENYFTQPCDSKLLNIVLVKSRQRMKRRNVDVSNIYRKLVRLPVEHGYVLIPMLHTMEQW